MEKTYEFENSSITFTIDTGKNVMVNATEMAKIFGKLPKDFLILDGTKAFINECLKKENSPFINISKEEDLYSSVQKSGTFMHRILALKFAAWLNPRFELWVYSTIDELLFGAYKEDEQTEREIGRIQAEIDRKEKQLSESPILREIEELKRKEDKARRALSIRRKQRTAGFRTFFTEEEMKNMET